MGCRHSALRRERLRYERLHMPEEVDDEKYFDDAPDVSIDASCERDSFAVAFEEHVRRIVDEQILAMRAHVPSLVNRTLDMDECSREGVRTQFAIVADCSRRFSLDDLKCVDAALTSALREVAARLGLGLNVRRSPSEAWCLGNDTEPVFIVSASGFERIIDGVHYTTMPFYCNGQPSSMLFVTLSTRIDDEFKRKAQAPGIVASLEPSRTSRLSHASMCVVCNETARLATHHGSRCVCVCVCVTCAGEICLHGAKSRYKCPMCRRVSPTARSIFGVAQ